MLPAALLVDPTACCDYIGLERFISKWLCRVILYLSSRITNQRSRKPCCDGQRSPCMGGARAAARCRRSRAVNREGRGSHNYRMGGVSACNRIHRVLLGQQRYSYPAVWESNPVEERRERTWRKFSREAGSILLLGIASHEAANYHLLARIWRETSGLYIVDR